MKEKLSSAPLIITVVSGLICYGIFYRRGIWLSVIAYSVSPAERVMLGEAPYRDFLFNYTPGILWLNAALMKLFGVSLVTINTGVLVFKLLSLICLFYVGRKLAGPWLALVPVALTLAWLGHRQIFNVHPTQYYVPFAILGLLFTLKYDESGKRHWLGFSGMSIGLVVVFKYNVGLLLLGCATASIVLRQALVDGGRSGPLRTTMKAVATCWIGFALVVGLLAAYLQSQGALLPMISHFLHHATDYSEERAIGLPSIRSVLPIAALLLTASLAGLFVVTNLRRVFHIYVALTVALISAALLIPGVMFLIKDSATAAIAYLPLLLFAGAAVVSLWRRPVGSDETEWSVRRRKLMIVALFSVGVYLEVYPRADYYHLVRILPLVFLLLMVLIDRLKQPVTEYLQRYGQVAPVTLALCAAAPVIVLTVIGIKDTWLPQFDGHFRFADNTELQLQRARGLMVTKRDAAIVNGLADIIEANSSPGEYIYSFARRGGAFYFLANRRNPTKLLWWDSVGIALEEKEAVLSVVASRHPRLVIVQDALTDPQVRRIVDDNYHPIGTVLDLVVYDRNVVSTVQHVTSPASR